MLDEFTLDRFSKNILTISDFNRTIEVTNEGPTGKVIRELSFLTNTPITPFLIDKKDNFTRSLLPNGYYYYKLIKNSPLDVSPNQTKKILDYEVTPTKNSDFQHQIGVNPLNVTAILGDGTTLFLPQTGQTKPIDQTFPIAGSFTRQQAYQARPFEKHLSANVTDLRLDSIVFDVKNGTLITTYSNEENYVWSVAQTVTEKTGRRIRWGLVGDCSNNRNQINWNATLPKFSEVMAKGIAKAFSVYGQKTPFSGITINTLGCKVNSHNLLTFMMNLNNALEETKVPLQIVIPMGTGAESLPHNVLMQLNHIGVQFIIDTASHRPPNDNLTETIQKLRSSGIGTKSIVVSIPAETPVEEVVLYCKIVKANKLYGITVNNLFNDTWVVETANNVLNNGRSKLTLFLAARPTINDTNLLPSVSEASIASTLDQRAGHVALAFMVGYGFWKAANYVGEKVGEMTRNFAFRK